MVLRQKIGQLAYFYDPIFRDLGRRTSHSWGSGTCSLSNPQLTPAQVQACLDSAADKLSNMGGADYNQYLRIRSN